MNGAAGPARDRDGQTDTSNGAYGKSEIEGKTAREAANDLGKERVSNGREHMSPRGQRTSFNGARGTRDIEGKVTRVGASERGQRASFKSGHLEAVAKHQVDAYRGFLNTAWNGGRN